MGDILFLSHRVPFPPDRGDKIRSHHLLKGLAKIAPVHVATFGETAQDMAQKGELKAIAKSHVLKHRHRPLWLAGIEAVLTGKPVSLSAFEDLAISNYVRKTIRDHRVDTIFVFSGQMGQYIPEDFRGRVIVDLCDVDSAKFEAYADAGQRRWINAREARLLSREEERLAHRADTTLLISDSEAGLLRSRIANAGDANIAALGNGIDAHFFDPAQVGLQDDLEVGDDPQLVFTGQMDYPPNIAAVEWVMAEVMPRLRQRYLRARFHIVGRAPGPALKSRHGENGVRVWGEVADVRPFLKSADVVLAPLLIARGVQNKVLEAMAMARPVVLTPAAATGIDARSGHDFIVAEPKGEEIVREISALVEDPFRSGEIGRSARQFVVGEMGWDAVYRQLAEFVSGAQGAGHGG
ncbi:TIGR03087 family PEP-CTERM/XrtA system glycosyltransferase [Qipengyuania soli]|uniref:TIGR03087 family PEP-CTERM/XrtA system glycosyltransferase n=1 Tax=Qipengyuania soli TaxID=2782568 RepID=A0A7S8F6P0_9SPHN|nr:TIGR03087 family PEP-CTERM/XrtA system glycosyltransferase [Qipengyuania soli]QPD00134.1 TIGR03087 family PEP-CTERM/XrtA system glycosyltransferase [Qipengyuania soli]